MPHSHLALARSRQEDFLREAERHHLAAAARRDRLTLRTRFVAFLRHRKATPADATRVAPAAE